MPAPEEFGAQPPLELLRQFLELGGFYDTKKLAWKVRFSFYASKRKPQLHHALTQITLKCVTLSIIIKTCLLLLRNWPCGNQALTRIYLFLFQDIVDVNIVAACGPPGGGRNPTTPRLLKHFRYL